MKAEQGKYLFMDVSTEVKEFKIYVKGRICCEVCCEVVSEYFNCPVCNKNSDIYMDVEKGDFFACEECRSILKIIEQHGDDEYDVKLIRKGE